MGYAKWDDGFMQNPPQPPKRPGMWEWRWGLTEDQRMAYEGALTAYLMAAAEPMQFNYWADLRLDLLHERIGGEHDGSPARRLPWRGR
jgi:hypothetical protein